MHPRQGLAAVFVACSLLLTACQLEVEPDRADPVQADSWRIEPDGATSTLEIPGIVGPLALARSARLVEYSDGVAALEGVLVSQVDPSRRWRLRLDIAGWTAGTEDTERAGEPAEAQPAGPGTRPGYAVASGELVGLDACLGARLRLICDSPGLSVETLEPRGRRATCDLVAVVTAQPGSGARLDTSEHRGSLRLRLTHGEGDALVQARSADRGLSGRGVLGPESRPGL